MAGQCLDVSKEGSRPTRDLVGYIHAHKTADLFIAPLEAGMMLWGAGEELVQAGRDYGYHLGMAFQMIDDCLDLQGDEALLGKRTGMDEARGKLTWPALAGLEATRRQAGFHMEQALAAAGKFKRMENFLKALAQTMLVRVQ